MNSLITALNESYRVSARAAEEIASMCDSNPKAAYLVDMILNTSNYDSLAEEYYNTSIRKFGEPRLQLFFSTVDGQSIIDLCEVMYMMGVIDALDLYDVVIENIEGVIKEQTY